jgi:hypothetical protein
VKLTGRIVTAIGLVTLLQCKKAAEAPPAPPPPLAPLPVSPTAGKCEPMMISVEGEVKQQWCHWEGYAWWCEQGHCWRKDPLPPERR